MKRTVLMVGALAALAALAACGGGTDARKRQPAPEPRAAETPVTPERRPPLTFRAYEPRRIEEYPNAKRIAGRIVQALTTYDTGASASAVAAAISPARDPSALARSIAPLVQSSRRSAGEILYAQLSGVTTRSLGAMVVVRQHLEDRRGSRTTVTRVVDVRLRRAGGPWRLDRVGSVGGRAVRRPRTLATAAARVVDHPNIALPDSARWDIYRGNVDDRLLRTLARVADRRRIAVAVLRTGHPANVWATSRESAHTAGYAADIYAVDGRLVIGQRATGTPAHQLARRLIAGGAAQVGSPWLLPPGGRRSFTDVVHQDHIHLQQSVLR